jgi:hypothetical protein
MRRAAGLLLALALAGCGSVPLGPAYTEDELAGICVRHGGWWHPDELRGGFCELETSGLP